MEEKKMKKKIMNEKNWKYMTLVLSMITIILLAVSVFMPVSIESAGISSPNLRSLPIDNLPDENDIFSVNNVITVRPVDFNPDDLDQHCTIYNTYGNIGPLWLVQSFKNSRSPMLGFSVLLSRSQMPEKPLILGIRSSLLGDTWVYATYISGNDLPNMYEWYWIDFEFPDPLSYSIGKTYYITLISEDIFEDGNHWRYAVDDSNSYSDGFLYKYDFSDPGWVPWSSYDGCFKTYTETDDPSPPIIDISVTSTISMQLGFIALIGAVLSGSKYYLSFVR
jgi:hypothetical protein